MENKECDCSKRFTWWEWIIFICVWFCIYAIFEAIGLGEDIAYKKYHKGEVEPIIKKIKYPNDPAKCDTVYKFIEH